MIHKSPTLNGSRQSKKTRKLPTPVINILNVVKRIVVALARVLFRWLEGMFLWRRPGIERGEYTLHAPGFFVSYSPWRTCEFERIRAPVKDRTLCKNENCYYVISFAEACATLPGDYAEAGVFKGGTAYLIAETIRASESSGRRLHLFDTFEGMPESANTDPSHLVMGQFGETSLQEVQAFLGEPGFVSYHQGRIPETFQGLQDQRFAFVHVDVDLYDSTMDCLEFFYERTVPGGIILFDDYGHAGYKLSEKKAADDFFANRPERPICLASGQAFVIKA